MSTIILSIAALIIVVIWGGYWYVNIYMPKKEVKKKRIIIGGFLLRLEDILSEEDFKIIPENSQKKLWLIKSNGNYYHININLELSALRIFKKGTRLSDIVSPVGGAVEMYTASIEVDNNFQGYSRIHIEAEIGRSKEFKVLQKVIDNLENHRKLEKAKKDFEDRIDRELKMTKPLASIKTNTT